MTNEKLRFLFRFLGEARAKQLEEGLSSRAREFKAAGVAYKHEDGEMPDVLKALESDPAGEHLLDLVRRRTCTQTELSKRLRQEPASVSQYLADLIEGTG